MPFKSKAQRRKFAELRVKGEISEETYEEWNRPSGSRKLPERVKLKKGRKAARGPFGHLRPRTERTSATGRRTRRAQGHVVITATSRSSQMNGGVPAGDGSRPAV